MRKSRPRPGAPTRPRHRNTVLPPHAVHAAPTRPPDATSTGRDTPAPSAEPSGRLAADGPIHEQATCPTVRRSSVATEIPAREGAALPPAPTTAARSVPAQPKRL